MTAVRNIFLVLATCVAPLARATDQIPITNNTVVTFVGDSFELSQYGDRSSFVEASYFINYYPQFYISFRDHSQGGQNNNGFVELNLPRYCVPDAFATQGTTNYLMFIYCSGNGGFDSNMVYTNLVTTLPFPGDTFNPSAVFTNDWTQSTNLYRFVIMGDPPYYGTDMHATYLYSDGGKVLGAANGWPYVDSWRTLSNAVATYNDGSGTFPNNTNLFFPPAYDHLANRYHAAWAFTSLTNLGVDTNAFTLVADWNSAAGWTTNHCTASGISQSGNSLNFTWHCDRMAPSFYVPDGTTTNDMREVFTWLPALGNCFHEDLRIANLPTGNYLVTIDGYSFAASSAQLSAGYNLWTNYTNPFHDQQMQVLYGICDMRDVLHTDNTTAAHAGAGNLLSLLESDARTFWPGSSGTASYATNSTILADENALFAQDVVIHGIAQQTNHTVTILLTGPRFAPFHK